jgi:hypothetical protein
MTNSNEEMFTQLPTVTQAMLTDIICAVQGGVSVQETLAQVVALGLSNSVLNYPGNPNGFVAGILNQFCWDMTDNILYICTTTGSTVTAIWTKVITLTAGTGISIVQNGTNIQINSSGGGLSWNMVTGTNMQMVSNNGYVSNNGSLVTLPLPLTSNFGDELSIAGLGTGGWQITQGAGQQILCGSINTTSGATGTLSSSYKTDSVNLLCLVANTIWTWKGAPQGDLTVF